MKSFLLFGLGLMASIGCLRAQENGMSLQLNLGGNYLWQPVNSFDMQWPSASLVIAKYDKRKYLIEHFAPANPDFHQLRYHLGWQNFRLQRSITDGIQNLALSNAFVFEGNRKLLDLSEKVTLYSGSGLIWYQGFHQSRNADSNELMSREINTGIIMTFLPLILIDLNESLYLEVAIPFQVATIDQRYTYELADDRFMIEGTNMGLFDGVGFRFGFGVRL